MFLTLEISNHDTHHCTEDEILQEHWNECERHAEHGQQEVADGEIQQKHVGHGAHPLVLDQRDDDQDITRDR